jgi:triosephosphate isomerase
VTPIVCVGETLAEREKNQTDAVVRRQVETVLEAIPDPKDLVIAYEPVWAIGTGRSATSAQAQDVHRFIRERIASKVSRDAAESLRILYGGSANPANIAELLAQKDIDGGLVGGASLKPADFAAMVRAAN